MDQANQINAIDSGVERANQVLDILVAQQRRQIALAEMQMRSGKIEDIRGYAYGRTSQDSPFIILYPSKQILKHKICRVYFEDFSKLPPFISRYVPDEAQEGNPDRDAAIRQGIYTDTDEFQIAVYPGKETQMGNEVRYMRYLPSETPTEPTAPTPATNKPYGDQAEVDYANELARRDQAGNDIEEPATVEAPPQIAVDNLNKALGLGESSADPKPTQPYAYKNGAKLSDDRRLNEIYYAYWNTTRQIPADPTTLRTWYEKNQDFINETVLNTNGATP